VVTDDYDQVEDLLGSEYYLFHQGGRAKDGSGASIASRWPLARVHEVSLPRTRRMDDEPGWIGSAAVAEVFLPEPFGRMLFVHHKPSWQCGFEAERELHAVATARFVEGMVEPRAVHVLLAGDLDATPASSSVRFWLGRQALQGTSVCYRDCWETCHGDEPGHTFTPGNPLVASSEMPFELGRRIDYLMVRCGDHGPTLRVQSCSRIFTEPSASDHYGVMAEVSLA
jgi:endonuclease/exonuclease/phosphatase family metal-dependent hydrolase